MLSLACVALLLSPQGGDWPEYRGPNRTGIVASSDWSVEGAAKPLWQATVGRGYSCPSIADGRLVTMGFDEAAGVDRVLCLDAKTGKQLWQYEYAAKDTPQYHGGGTLTTPTLRDGRVYCVNRIGQVHVLDLKDGSVQWTRDYRKELAIEDTFHGFSASPALEGDRIYLQLGGLVAAVRASDGDVLWQTTDIGDASYANLALLNIGETRALATMRATTFFVLACKDGRVLHEYPWPIAGSAVHCAIPIPVGDDRVFLSTAYNKGAAMIRLGKEKLAERIWSNRRMRNKVTACVLHEEHVYGFDESMLRCLDTDGKSKWRVRGLGLGSLSMAGGRLLILNADGELIIAEADPSEFRELSRKKVLDGGVYWTMPVLVDGLIYVRNSLGDLACLDHRSKQGAVANAPKAAPDSMPKATQLFAAHAEAVASDTFGVRGQALRLQGTWAIPLRGMPPEAMTWTLAGPDHWKQSADSGGMEYTFSKAGTWAIEPQGARMIEGDELFELEQLFPLDQLFAPACPPGAMTVGQTRFAERTCWKVTATTAASSTEASDSRTFYFDTETGQLRGTEGKRRSTIVYDGTQRLSGLTLPQRITRYRAEDGQEHIMVITAAEWTEIGNTFAKPLEIKLLLRTPAEIARDTKQLTERFRHLLARYKPTKTNTPLGDEEVELTVRDGSLWFGPSDDLFRVRVESEKNGVYPIAGIPVEMEIITDDAGGKTFALITPDGKLPFERLKK